MIKPTDMVDVVIGFHGQKVRASLSYQRYQELTKSAEAGKKSWQTVQLGHDSEVRVRLDNIQFIKLLSRSKAKAAEIDGVTLYQVAQVMRQKYHTLRQKLKHDGVDLEKTSGRRVLINDKNIGLLKMSKEQVTKLRELEKGNK